jgi:hypothetical protein
MISRIIKVKVEEEYQFQDFVGQRVDSCMVLSLLDQANLCLRWKRV